MPSTHCDLCPPRDELRGTGRHASSRAQFPLRLPDECEAVRITYQAGHRISMDVRGRALDNIFVERLWRTVKYENVYLMEYATVPDLIAD